MGFVHLSECVDETVFEWEGGEVGSVGTLLVWNFADVGGLDGRFVFAHGYGPVIDFLLVDSRWEEDIECGIDNMPGGFLGIIVHFNIHVW